MKKIITALICAALVVPLVAQDYNYAGMDYTKALLKKPLSAKIEALRAYINKYPDTDQRFTKLAYYQLSSSYFSADSYENAITYGKKTLSIMSFETNPNEVAKTHLVLGNSYGIKSSSQFNREEALTHINKAISLATQMNDQQILSSAQDLKNKLSGPPPKQETPEQKFLRLYKDGMYNDAADQYQKLTAEEQSADINRTVYAKALVKANQLSRAAGVYLDMYQDSPKGTTAYELAKIYDAQKKYDQAVDYYLDSSLLYQGESNYNNSKIARTKARVVLQNKYNYDAVYRKAKRSLEANKQSSSQIEKAIRDKERELRRLDLEIRSIENETGFAAPPHLIQKKENLQREIAQLKSGQSTPNPANKEYQEFEQLKKKIDAEFQSELAQAKERIQ
jgi:hypothetical protein